MAIPGGPGMEEDWIDPGYDGRLRSYYGLPVI